MTETLFERYKEALRAGHVAVVRGRLEDAAAAYREAIAIAPDRAVPQAALGGVHLRLGEPEAALAAYDAALALALDDDAATLGRAQALVVLRRTDEAAATYDRLADLRAAADRRGDAAEAARRALAIEPTAARRSRHADLAGLPADADLAGGPGDAAADAGSAIDAEEAPAEPPPDLEALEGALEEAAAGGEPDAVAAAALAAARAYRDRGHAAAAFDACLEGIGARPADVELHLLLAELAVGRGWTDHAADTYRGLLRLVELDGNAELAETIRSAAAERLPGAPGLAPA